MVPFQDGDDDLQVTAATRAVFQVALVASWMSA